MLNIFHTFRHANPIDPHHFHFQHLHEIATSVILNVENIIDDGEFVKDDARSDMLHVTFGEVCDKRDSYTSSSTRMECAM